MSRMKGKGYDSDTQLSSTDLQELCAAFKQNPGCSAEAVKQYLQAAQNELVRIQGQNPRLSQMRTTVVILVTDFEGVTWGHVGDSRLYRLEDGKIHFQSHVEVAGYEYHGVEKTASPISLINQRLHGLWSSL
jgi:serine/threonine protein phosphatase PrpC